jgi:hypothetical protein
VSRALPEKAVARTLWASRALPELAVAKTKTTELAVAKTKTAEQAVAKTKMTEMAVAKTKTTVAMSSFDTLFSTASSCSPVSPSADEAVLAYPAVPEVAVRLLEEVRLLDVEAQGLVLAVEEHQQAEVVADEEHQQAEVVAVEEHQQAEVVAVEEKQQAEVLAEEGLQLAVEAVMIRDKIMPTDMSMLQVRTAIFHAKCTVHMQW